MIFTITLSQDYLSFSVEEKSIASASLFLIYNLIRDVEHIIKNPKISCVSVPVSFINLPDPIPLNNTAAIIHKICNHILKNIKLSQPNFQAITRLLNVLNRLAFPQTSECNQPSPYTQPYPLVVPDTEQSFSPTSSEFKVIVNPVILSEEAQATSTTFPEDFMALEKEKESSEKISDHEICASDEEEILVKAPTPSIEVTTIIPKAKKRPLAKPSESTSTPSTCFSPPEKKSLVNPQLPQLTQKTRSSTRIRHSTTKEQQTTSTTTQSRIKASSISTKKLIPDPTIIWGPISIFSIKKKSNISVIEQIMSHRPLRALELGFKNSCPMSALLRETFHKMNIYVNFLTKEYLKNTPETASEAFCQESSTAQTKLFITIPKILLPQNMVWDKEIILIRINTPLFYYALISLFTYNLESVKSFYDCHFPISQQMTRFSAKTQQKLQKAFQQKNDTILAFIEKCKIAYLQSSGATTLPPFNENPLLPATTHCNHCQTLLKPQNLPETTSVITVEKQLDPVNLFIINSRFSVPRVQKIQKTAILRKESRRDNIYCYPPFEVSFKSIKQLMKSVSTYLKDSKKVLLLEVDSNLLPAPYPAKKSITCLKSSQQIFYWLLGALLFYTKDSLIKAYEKIGYLPTTPKDKHTHINRMKKIDSLISACKTKYFQKKHTSPTTSQTPFLPFSSNNPLLLLANSSSSESNDSSSAESNDCSSSESSDASSAETEDSTTLSSETSFSEIALFQQSIPVPCRRQLTKKRSTPKKFQKK